jgi:hypothetical protein
MTRQIETARFPLSNLGVTFGPGKDFEKRWTRQIESRRLALRTRQDLAVLSETPEKKHGLDGI